MERLFTENPSTFQIGRYILFLRRGSFAKIKSYLQLSVNIERCFVGIALAIDLFTNHWCALLVVYVLCNVYTRNFVFVASSQTRCADVKENF